MRSPRSLIVWAVTASMVGAALVLVARYAHNIPYYDDWSMVAVLAGAEPVDLRWLWEPRNGHRIAVPKLVLLGLHTVTNWDFRAGMYASVLLLAVASGALILAASRRRGSIRYSDAVFPLLLLNWGQYDNLLWGWQVTQVLPLTVTALFLAAIVRWDFEPPFRVAVLAGLGLVTLPLSGVLGLACTPGLGLWLGGSAHRRWVGGTGSARRQAVVIWVLTAIALLLVPVYFVALRNTGVPPLDVIPSAKTAVSFLAYGLGPAAGVMRPWPTVATFVVFVVATGYLLVALRNPNASRRAHAGALLCALIAFAGLTASVASRPYGLPHRYFLFAAPALCWVYLVVDFVHRRDVARAGRAVLLLVAAAVAVYNAPAGLGSARARSAGMSAFAADVRAGLPASQLLARHQRTLMPFPGEGGAFAHDVLALDFDALRRSRIGVFASLAPERSVRPLDILSVAERTFTTDADGRSAWMWRLAEPSHVAGIRIQKPDSVRDGPWTLEWTPTASAPFVRARRYVHWWTAQEKTATVWIYDSVAMLRHPVPATGEAPPPPHLQLLLPAGGQ